MENGISQTSYPHYNPSSSLDIITMFATYYYRWSTEGQTKKKKFVDNKVVQEEKEAIVNSRIKECRDALDGYKGFCSKCNREIRLIYANMGYLDKGISGRKVEREDIDKLIADAELGKFQVVITPMSSRLGRRRSVSSTIRDKVKDAGVQVYSINQPIPLKCPDCFDVMGDDSQIISESISDMQAELELSHIRQNYKSGMPLRIKEGKPAGSLAYGLIKEYKKTGEVYYQWDEEKVTIVKRIAKEFLEGAGILLMVKRLNLENIPSPQDSLWGRSTIYCILKNPVYAGYNRFGWKISKGKKRIIQPREKWMVEEASFKGIWDMSYYEKLEKEFKRRKFVGNRAVSSSSLLVGLLRCGNHTMCQTGTTKRRQNGNVYTYRGYICARYVHTGICISNGVKQSILDQIVLTEIANLFDENTRQTYFKKLQKGKKAELEKQTKEIIKLKETGQKEWQRAKDAYIHGVDSIADYARNKEKYEPYISSLSTNILELEKRIKNATDVVSWGKSYKEAVSKFLNFPNAEDKSKIRHILSQIIDTIEFKKKPYSVKINYKVF